MSREDLGVLEPACLLQLQRRKKGTFYCGERGRAFHPRSPRADAGPMPEAKAVGGNSRRLARPRQRGRCAHLPLILPSSVRTASRAEERQMVSWVGSLRHVQGWWRW